MSKKILLVCYAFPPYPGIGGRRWAKFAKYLKRNGHEVQVIAAKNPFSEQSLWEEDIEGIDVHYLPLNYPKVLITQPQNFLQKFTYRTALKKVQQEKGNYYDRALFWKEQLLNKGSELIKKHNIKNVIVSGAPFHLTHHCLELKKLFPEINLISDFRDFWTQDVSISAFAALDKERQAWEQQLEKEVMEQSDHVITVADYMKESFAQLGGNAHTLLNGYDPDDFKGLELNNRKEEGKLNFVFTGTLYINAENIFFPFVDALKALKESNASIYKNLSFDFYGTAPASYQSYVKEQGVDVVSFHGNIPRKEVYEKIAGADVCLLFLNDVYNFSLSTKFYEYLSQKKKVLLFSKEGATAQFVQEHRLGMWIDPGQAAEGLKKAIDYFQHSTAWESALEVEQFSIAQITTQLEALLIE